VELEEAQVIRKACRDQEELMSESLLFAKSFTKKRPIFGETKRRMYGHIITLMENEDPKYIEPLKLTM